MLCDPISYYPQQIDEMTFFQDTNLENVKIMDYYNGLISQGKYSEASDYINQQKDIYGFFADFFNLIENRIFALQCYLLTKNKSNPFIFYDKKQYFTIENISIFSNIDEKESLEKIKLFSDADIDESLEGLFVFRNEKEEDAEPMTEKYAVELEPTGISTATIWI